ncbi:predicted protein [Naegleria gruberi]|uniref:Predicted protein n=1 Tax=Naegleria gruberi TaxID=5762 RepID=D2V9E3_NAEGR|nr:uncharacterized protein NAEGRDRAFT_65411 [Naegleria gruberi]EFC46446.1 predicted protein [Naegleria gruberi]|eukprot:XP_002679190.1 predicted protein [Naegleria gruberi strain NEG-M]
MVEKYYYDINGYRVKRNCASANDRIYLNSGLYVGRKRDIRKALSIGLNVKRGEPKERIEDQALFQYIYATNKYPILMDCEKKMFYSPFSACDTIVSEEEKKWSCSIRDGQEETPDSVVYVHSNGGFCYSLCNCFTSMKQKGMFKNLMEQYQDKLSFKSYDINSRKVRSVLMKYACGHFVDEDFALDSCNTQPPPA